MDPASGTVDQQTSDEEQKNRRVELVLQPDVDEMLNLKDLTADVVRRAIDGRPRCAVRPMRVATIDIGTNTVLLLVAERRRGRAAARRRRAGDHHAPG